MKTLLFGILIATLFGASPTHINTPIEFECVLTVAKKTYKPGETPELKVAIVNKTRKDVYLIGSLDASDLKWRSPHCYFSIERPNKDPLPGGGRCGNMNSLRENDFVLVKSGESFDPYQSIDGYGFFGPYIMGNKDAFKAPGTYKITFHYSTKSTKIGDYLGDGSTNEKLLALFMQMPHIELTSNTVEIEVKD
jgi:hypothetical protein